jgi:Matrixin/Carboxypeptidase regulatory-like domain
MKKFIFSFALVGIFLVVGVNNVFAQARLASRFGEAMVGGRRLIVHVTVAVPTGWDENAVAENALRDHGARPIQRSEFTLEGIRWDQFSNGPTSDAVPLHYNPAGEPLAALTSLTSAQATWNNVVESTFTFSYAGTTTRCPSLVGECPGPQTFDGYNDVGWVAMGGCCTLGVTWYSTGTDDEADTALNSRFRWTTSSGSGFDVETVLLHEIGHTLGLGHSSVIGAIMEATYAGVRRSLHEDDKRGVTYLYPEPAWIGEISGMVTAAVGGTPISGANISIADLPVSTTSGPNGQYTLTGVPNIGSYSITATATGYDSHTLNGVTVPSYNKDFTLAVKSGSGGSSPCVRKSSNANNCH